MIALMISFSCSWLHVFQLEMRQEILMLLAKIRYALGDHQGALDRLDELSLDDLPLRDISSRKMKLTGESFAIKGLRFSVGKPVCVCFLSLSLFLLSVLLPLMNYAARLVFLSSKYHSISLLLHQSHWLNATKRIQFKLTVLAFKCLHETVSPYRAYEFLWTLRLEVVFAKITNRPSYTVVDCW